MARRPRPRRILKPNTTILIVGEGETEGAFLKHLKSIYAPRNCGRRSTVLPADGKGPGNVIEYALHQPGFDGFTFRGALLDTDQKWPVGKVNKAR